MSCSPCKRVRGHLDRSPVPHRDTWTIASRSHMLFFTQPLFMHVCEQVFVRGRKLEKTHGGLRGVVKEACIKHQPSDFPPELVKDSLESSYSWVVTMGVICIQTDLDVMFYEMTSPCPSPESCGTPQLTGQFIQMCSLKL